MKENSTQAERLSLLMQHFKLNQTSFSRETGIKQANLSPVLNGKKELSRGMTTAILERYERLSANWLIKGVGPMFIEEISGEKSPAENELTEPDVPYAKGLEPLEALRRLLEDYGRRIAKLEEEVKQLLKKKK